MKKQKTVLAIIICMTISLAACASGTNTSKEKKEQNPYYPDNEMITVEDLDDGRMPIVVEIQYNVSTSDIEKVIESQFPDVNVILHLQNTPDSPYLTKKSLENNQLGDIFFCATGLTKDEEMISKYFVDLSNAPFINNYYQNALDGVEMNGKIYMLPGFSDLFGIVYDRTLFEEQGWELPQSRDEFISLCKTINNTMGYQAFMPTLRFGRMAMMMSHAFNYESVIAGVENQKWLRDYRDGNASFSGHMEPMFEGMKELFDAGVLSDQNFEVEPGVRSTMLYNEHTAAMTMETQSGAAYAVRANSDHEYGMMPFWNGNDKNSDYIVSAPGFNIYVNKQLETSENSEKLDKVMDILAYFSTPEGQEALMSEESATISNVKGTDSTSGGAFMEGVADTIAKGNIFQEVRYTSLTHNNPFQVAFREAMMGYLDGAMDLTSAMAHCDTAMQDVLSASTSEGKVYGTAKETFTVMETAEFVADILRETADAEVALVLARELTYGETGNFFKGDITDTTLQFVTLDYVTGKDPAYNKLVTVELTGQQIVDILNYPYFEKKQENDPNKWQKSGTPAYWVPSNLKVEYAPFLQGNIVQNISNMDGSEFDLKKTYKTAVWNGCFSNLTETEYFDQETLKAMVDVTPVSEETSVDLIKKAIEKAGKISPYEDSRITLNWDIKPEKK